MGYLVCDKCGGYYKLQEGENPNDFTDRCECGENLKYVQNLYDHVVNEMDPMDGISICPNCGEKNDYSVNFCQNCGENLNKGIPESNNNLTILGYILATLGWLPLFIGTIVAIFIGITLYRDKNIKNRRNGKYIVIIALIIPLILVLSITAITYYYLFILQTFDTQNEMNLFSMIKFGKLFFLAIFIGIVGIGLIITGYILRKHIKE